MNDRAPERHAGRDDVHEATEGKGRPEREHTESDVHPAPIGGRTPKVERYAV